MISRARIAAAFASAVIFGAGAASATLPTPAQKCRAAKLQAAKAYGSCRLAADRKAVLNVKSADYGKCDTAVAAAYAKAEAKAAGACPTVGDVAQVQARVSGDTGAVTNESSGTQPTALRRLPAAGQTTPLVSGDDGTIQAGASLHYVDNGDGTITDSTTGLMWEKKDDDNLGGLAGLHDQDNSYPWAGNCRTGLAICGSDVDCGGNGPCDVNDGQQTNLTVFGWIAQLNAGSGFAGQTDWRIPNKKEMESIVDAGAYNPAVDPVFNTNCGVSDPNFGSGNSGNPGCTVITCSCTATQPSYWASTVFAGDSTQTWAVLFYDGTVSTFSTNTLLYVRAVRGGL